MKKNIIVQGIMSVMIVLWSIMPARAVDPDQIVKEAFNYLRGDASVSKVDMTIYRPDWQRKMTIKAWTIGEADSMFTIVAPAKDKGNSTLKKGQEMWMFNPKVNRVIKLPPSMMSQAWMGSDFSNDDLSKTDSILHDYDHTMVGQETSEGKIVYVIKSMPKLEAPVVWGMQMLKIREDHIFLSQAFYDEDLKLVKTMTGTNIKPVSGKLYPMTWKMQKADTPDEYTLLEYQELKFVKELPKRIFTMSNLRNPVR